MQAAGLISACIGLVLFLDGLRVCIMPLAEEVGQRLPQRLSLPLVMVVAFVLVSPAGRDSDQPASTLTSQPASQRADDQHTDTGAGAQGPAPSHTVLLQGSIASQL